MKSRLQTVRSSDGTTIAYEQSGTGPALVLIHGSISDRSYWTPVVPVLAEHFNVVTVDRRGRGDSGDTDAYALEREFEDIAAVVAAISEPVHLVGHSYGGLCALGAARVSDDLASLTLYEPALVDGATIPEEFVAALEAMIAAGERDAAVELMMDELVGLPVEALAELRTDRGAWQPMVDCVHTLPRELRVVGAFAFDADSFRDIAVPTLLLRGADSPIELHVGVDMVLAAIGGARAVTMPGVGHEAVTTGPDVLITALTGVPA